MKKRQKKSRSWKIFAYVTIEKDSEVDIENTSDSSLISKRNLVWVSIKYLCPNRWDIPVQSDSRGEKKWETVICQNDYHRLQTNPPFVSGSAIDHPSSLKNKADLLPSVGKNQQKRSIESKLTSAREESELRNAKKWRKWCASYVKIDIRCVG